MLTTSDQPVAETATHTTQNTRMRQASMPLRVSNPQPQKSNGRRLNAID